ncbi:MAG TPA: serine hydrolase domain-containing protein [Acidimicrobiia bacterium]|nr:serine hydrolase domain-containing protein [Acidimicrobiia bacterium]
MSGAPADRGSIELGGVPGCAIGVVRAGDEPEHIFGGSRRAGEPVNAATIWEAASLTKPLVTLGALALGGGDPTFLTRPLEVQPSAVGAVDDPRWRELTIRHLVTHTTGLPNWRPAGEPLAFVSDPGTFGYSGEGFELLLAELCARVGASALDLLEPHLRRLGMESSSFTFTLPVQATAAFGHDDHGRPVAKKQPEVPMGSGSLHTTLQDYLQFATGICSPATLADPLLQAAARTMTETQIELLPGHGRTFGWAYIDTPAGRVLWQHGDNPGFKHVVALRPVTGDGSGTGPDGGGV